MWFALAYGTGMRGVDAVAFRGAQAGGNDGAVDDLWLAGNYSPSADGTNSYSPTSAASMDNGTYNFVTMRALDTGDSQDFVVVCGQTYNFKWVGNSSSASTSNKHNKEGNWLFQVNEDCSIGSGASGSMALAVSSLTAAGLWAVNYL